MKSYSWWLGRKKRVRKKYHLFCGRYMSPKELREWLKEMKEYRRMVGRRSWWDAEYKEGSNDL